ncbi:MAG: 30S ribosomal protein S17 [Candidatus Kerfeldbacteria bacterium CG15_BIG_FIL_POST_REV_8_21_14_020_45_12]|uniref:Small ribosomal subunit protein uS17 n=1 Tax=Candidatus Kerfeldbacteria bacterium CG15_BIG_FIL_POST_REV_8_21_14_020_45_12 TaxID=2014247 RepID=A0A2M7H3Q9_9BACT|nr:MAG: 30S ribosomal protein S17 [Candidatus Kerfeldbacteria bacterium CG15_BIG_FIL_POST_REV_8_21_14_020_45_12]PJA93993.1 MAG: 30S ribosomal protein S17 [Candidatus Kerfeldbacteria bacterium CG_4_9_14_3_um_filter_45_8]
MTDDKKTTEARPKLIRRFKGVVVSDVNDQTIVVKVERRLRHKLYGKLYSRSRKFHVHDPKNQYVIGDKVEFMACRPMSKLKRWRVIYTGEKVGE